MHARSRGQAPLAAPENLRMRTRSPGGRHHCCDPCRHHAFLLHLCPVELLSVFTLVVDMRVAAYPQIAATRPALARSHPVPHWRAHAQVNTLFNDLDDEVQSGLYINSAGQPQDTAILNYVLADSTRVHGEVLPRSPHAPSSPSSDPPQPLPRRAVPVLSSLAHSAAADGLSPAHVSPRTTNRRPLPPMQSASGAQQSSTPAAVAPHSSVVVYTHARGNRPVRPMRPHRAAVRAVLPTLPTLPCGPIPENSRADFDPPGPPGAAHSPRPWVSPRDATGARRPGRQPAAAAATAARALPATAPGARSFVAFADPHGTANVPDAASDSPSYAEMASSTDGQESISLMHEGHVPPVA